MELDFRLRRLELPQGVVLIHKPLNLDQYQRWISAIVKVKDKSPTDQAADGELMALAVSLLKETNVGVEGVTIRATDATAARPGTLEDLLSVGGIGLTIVFRAMIALFQSSGLAEPEAKNSVAPPIGGQPGLAALKE